MLNIANIRNTRVCAFCKNWYDPANSAIQPYHGDFFKYDSIAQKRCLKKKLDTKSWTSCGNFECKL